MPGGEEGPLCYRRYLVLPSICVDLFPVAYYLRCLGWVIEVNRHGYLEDSVAVGICGGGASFVDRAESGAGS